MDTDEYGINRCIAACNDLAASMKGCSEHEKRLRAALPVSLYDNNPVFREIMIKLEVLKYSDAWWLS